MKQAPVSINRIRPIKLLIVSYSWLYKGLLVLDVIKAFRYNSLLRARRLFYMERDDTGLAPGEQSLTSWLLDSR